MSVFKRIDENLAKEIEDIRRHLTRINGFDVSFPKASKTFYKKYLALKFNKKLNKEEEKILGFRF